MGFPPRDLAVKQVRDDLLERPEAPPGAGRPGLVPPAPAASLFSPRAFLTLPGTALLLGPFLRSVADPGHTALPRGIVHENLLRAHAEGVQPPDTQIVHRACPVPVAPWTATGRARA
jgi:hypothetical protein